MRTKLATRGITVPAAAALIGLVQGNASASVPTTLSASLGKVALSAKSTAVAAVISVVSGTLFSMPNVFTKLVVGSVATIGIVLSAWFVESSLNEESESHEFVAQTANEVEAPSDEEAIEEASTVLVEPVEVASEYETTDDADVQSEVETSKPVLSQSDEMAEEETAPTGVISGKVYDLVDNSPVAEATVVLRDDVGDAEPIQTVQTDANSYFEYRDVPLGKYRVVPDFVDGYPLTGHLAEYVEVSLSKYSKSKSDYDIGLSRAGVLTGKVVVGGEALRNAVFRISTLDSGTVVYPFNFDFGEIQTDDEGRFRVNGIPEFEGNMWASRIRPDGNRQHALHLVTRIELNEETEVTFDFAGGNSSITGTVYYGFDKLPVEARITAYFKMIDVNGDYTDEDITFHTNERGEFHIGELPEGDAELHVRVEGIRRVVSVPLRWNEDVTKNIFITETNVVCNVSGIPRRTILLLVTACPGEIELNIVDQTSLLQYRDMMVAVSDNHPGGASEFVASLKGLEPGTYTIVASSWPVNWEIQRVIAYGAEKFFEDLVHATQVITIEPGDDEILIDLVFAPE